MSNKNLTGHALQIIYRFWFSHNHAYPTSREIVDELTNLLKPKKPFSVNDWGGIKNRLMRKGMLRSSELWGFEFTNKALESLQGELGDKPIIVENKLSPTLSKKSEGKIKGFGKLLKTDHSSGNYVDFSLYGAVKAGVGSRLDDLAVYSGEESISIPHTESDISKVFVLRVDGESMIHEDIFPGDFIVVEKVSLIELREGDLVVVKYLPEGFNKKTREEVDLARQDVHSFEGPTLKYYSKQKKGSGEIMHRLSWKTDAQESPFAIHTRYIDPDEVGKVVAVFTPERYRRIV